MEAIRLTPRERGYLESLIQGGQWSQSRKYECGYAAGPLCLKCGQFGPLLHRHCECGGWPPEL
eukprot:4581887-Pyramimonas_sp.AAC.1